MRHAHLAWLAALATLVCLPAPLMAQDWDDPPPQPVRVEFGASAGSLMSTRWSDIVLLGSISSASGVLEQVLTPDLRVQADTDFTADVTYWRGRYGFRTQGGFSRSSLHVGATPAATNPPSTLPASGASVGVDTYFYDVRGAIGFLDYRPTRWVWPYAFGGIGGITYKLNNPVTPTLTVIGSAPIGPNAGTNTVIVAGNGRQFVLGIDELGTETVLAFNFGIGAQFRIPLGAGGVGVRVEVADQASSSPLRIRMSDFSGHSSEVGLPVVHQMSVTAGIVVGVGR